MKANAMIGLMHTVVLVDQDSLEPTVKLISMIANQILAKTEVTSVNVMIIKTRPLVRHYAILVLQCEERASLFYSLSFFSKHVRVCYREDTSITDGSELTILLLGFLESCKNVPTMRNYLVLPFWAMYHKSRRRTSSQHCFMKIGMNQYRTGSACRAARCNKSALAVMRNYFSILWVRDTTERSRLTVTLRHHLSRIPVLMYLKHL